MGLDPIKPVRVRIDAARLYNDWCLNHQTEPKEVVLHLSHNRGGGTQKFINELMHELESKGIASFNIYPLSNNSCTLRSHLLNIPNLDIIKYSSGIDEVKALIEGLHITKIHIHSLVDWNLIISDVLLDIAEKLGIQIFISVHDYHWCCSKINLMPNDRDCCIDLSKKSCFACDKNNMISTYEIRLKARMLFSKAKKVIFPNEDVLQRYSDVFKIDNYKVIPHIESYDHIRLNKSDNGSNFNICVIGNISVPKGSKVIQRLESYIIENNIKSTITIIGKTDIKINGVKYSGIYKNFEELSYKVKQIAPSIIFIPSIVPETYSYVLSEALALGVPVATFNIGAQANRMKGLGLAKNLIDLDLKDYPEKLYCSLVKITKNQCLQSFTDFSENSNDVLEYYI